MSWVALFSPSSTRSRLFRIQRPWPWKEQPDSRKFFSDTWTTIQTKSHRLQFLEVLLFPNQLDEEWHKRSSRTPEWFGRNNWFASTSCRVLEANKNESLQKIWKYSLLRRGSITKEALSQKRNLFCLARHSKTSHRTLKYHRCVLRTFTEGLSSSKSTHPRNLTLNWKILKAIPETHNSKLSNTNDSSPNTHTQIRTHTKT
jgi:hypothetical protein